ncbi:MAG TPA: zinc ABC transporter substrate-binding protein, partial [bacterium]
DAWVAKLLAASRSAKREVIEVGKLAGRRDGDNPHVWYDVRAATLLVETLTQRLTTLDPTHKEAYAARAATVQRDLKALAARIDGLRKQHGGTPVTATEPVFGYMSDALGLTMRNLRFQLAQMNDTEPTASDIAAFEADLRGRKVRVLFNNTQTSEGLTTRLLGIAKASGVAVVGVTETMPQGASYVGWMNAQLDTLEQALARK